MFDPSAWLHASARRGTWRALLVLLLVVTSWFAFMPMSGSTGLSHIDKLQHLAAFVALAAVAVLAGTPTHRHLLHTVLGLLAYGAFIEAVQSYLPTRSADWADWLADAAGIGLGLLLARALRRRWPAAC